MGKFFDEYVIKRLKDFLRNLFAPIIEINQRYATPHLKTSKAVKFSLICLRIYLIVLVSLLFYKFYLTLRQ